MRSPRWQRTNHAGDPVTLLEGPAYVAGAALGAAAGGPAGVVAVLGSGAFGALDDLAGDGASKGLKGHLGAAARGRVTTGLVKVVGIGATGLVAATLADRRRDDVGLLDTLVGGAVVAGAANLANLLDLRPGRALKVTVLSALPLLVAGDGESGVRAAAAAGAALGVLRPDLAGTRDARRHRRQRRGCARGHRPARGDRPARAPRRARRSRRAHPGLREGLVHPGHRVDPGAARARRLGPARTMTRRRFASGIAGAAGLIAVTTLLARTAGFARILVFTESVRAGGVGGIYQSVNAIPNVMFEIAAGGILAAVAVPLIAHQLGAGQRDRADHTASVLLSWALLVLVPLAALLWLFAGPLSSWLVTSDPAAHEVATTLLRIFAVQVPLYGLGIILTGLLQAHRRFLAAALAPLASSVVVLVSYLWYGSIVDGQVEPALVSAEAVRVLGWGTTLGVVVLSVPLVVPAMRTGWRWHPALRMPSDDARRIGALAGAGVIALLAQQAAVLATMWLSKESGDKGTFTVYTYAQAVYLLPYAVLAVPVATSAFPALAARTGAGEDVSGTLARSLRAVLVLTALSVGVLIAAAPAIGAFFSLLDAQRGDGATSTAALAALPATLMAYAPGLVGFGLGALLIRALYVRGRPTDAGIAAGTGWAVAAVLPLVLLAGGQHSPATTLRWLGVASTLGMTLSAVLLVLLVRRSWGPEVTAGAGRTTGALVVAVALAVAVGDLVTRGRTIESLPEAVLVGAAAGAVALVVGVVALSIGDREMMSQVLRRGRSRRRGGSQG